MANLRSNLRSFIQRAQRNAANKAVATAAAAVSQGLPPGQLLTLFKLPLLFISDGYEKSFESIPLCIDFKYPVCWDFFGIQYVEPQAVFKYVLRLAQFRKGEAGILRRASVNV